MVVAFIVARPSRNWIEQERIQAGFWLIHGHIQALLVHHRLLFSTEDAYGNTKSGCEA